MYRPLSVSGQSQLLRDRTGLLLARDVSSHLPTHQIDVLFRNCGSRRFRRGPQACEVIDDTALGASQLQLAQDRLAQEKQKNRNESPEYLSSTKGPAKAKGCIQSKDNIVSYCLVCEALEQKAYTAPIPLHKLRHCKQVLVETAMFAAVGGLVFSVAAVLKLQGYMGYLLPMPIVLSAIRSGPTAARKTVTATAFLLFGKPLSKLSMLTLKKSL